MAGLRGHEDLRGRGLTDIFTGSRWRQVADGLWDRKTCEGATVRPQAPGRVVAQGWGEEVGSGALL